jgi:hypothetical protein
VTDLSYTRRAKMVASLGIAAAIIAWAGGVACIVYIIAHFAWKYW